VGQNFTVSFTLKEFQGASKTFEYVELWIQNSTGSDLYMAQRWNSVSFSANQLQSFSATTNLDPAQGRGAGTYRAMVRGKVAGDVPFNFGVVSGSGAVNPRTFIAAPEQTFTLELLDGRGFVNGQEISANLNILAHGGSPRHGAATDGEARLLLRANASGPGTMTFTLLEPSEGDTIYAPGASQTGTTLTVTVQPTDYGAKAFAVYQPPKGFVRPDHPEDKSAATRATPLRVTFTPSGASAPTQTMLQYIDLKRPPVVLIHGLWGNMSSWKTFEQKLIERIPGLTVHVADYSATNAASFATNKSVPGAAVVTARNRLRNSGFASVKADVFGHSMGGILSRLWAGDNQYKSDRNYGKGDFNKLVTVDSPHYGSPLADLTWLLWNDTGYRAIIESLYGVRTDFAFGAFGDLQTSGSPGLPGIDVPAHAIVGNYVPTVDDLADLVCAVNTVAGEAYLVIPCKTWGLLKFLGYDTGISTHFPVGGDLVVGVSSQRDGLGAKEFNVIHSCFSDYPCVLGEPAVVNHAVDLLNARPDNTPFSAGLSATHMATASSTLHAQTRSNMMARSVATRGTGVRISSPVAGSTVAPGQTVTVLLEADSGVSLSEAMLVSPGATRKTVSPPWQFDLTVPESLTGDFPISLAAKDAGGVMHLDNILLRIQTPAALISLTVVPDSMVIDSIGVIQNVTVNGYYADASVRSLSSAASGTVFATSNPSVVTVDANGVVRAVGNGSAMITASHGGFTATVAAVEAPADLSLTLSATPSAALPGQAVTYILTVSNAGPQTAVGLVVSDRLPDGATFVSADGAGWICIAFGQMVECRRDSLAVEASSRIELVVNAPASVGTMINVADVRASSPDSIIDNNWASLGLAGSTVPGAPTAVSATAGNAQAMVSFTPGSLGSGTLISYMADCGGITNMGGSSPITVTGLTNGSSYTCRVMTTTTVGASAWSGNSNSVTPSADTLPDTDCVLNWAESLYPNLFAPAGAVSQTLAPYYFRYYSGTNAYLGTSSADSHLYYLGPATGNTLFDAGPLSNWRTTAGCP